MLENLENILRLLGLTDQDSFMLSKNSEIKNGVIADQDKLL